MIVRKLRGWRTTSVAAAALSLAACGGEGGEAGSQAGEGGEEGEASVSAGPAVTPAASVGGEAGEAGAASAYAGLSGDQMTALHIQHLHGFVMAAARVLAEEKSSPTAAADAAVLVQQGLLEVYEAAPDQFGDLDIAVIRAAADGNLNRAQMMQRVRASEAEINRALGELDVDYAVLTVRMVDIATGLYQGVVQADFVDPIEYQHSMGAAQAARASLNQNALQRRNIAAYLEAQQELDRFVGLWPQAAAPERPASYREVLAQSSRVRLALSPFL